MMPELHELRKRIPPSMPKRRGGVHRPPILGGLVVAAVVVGGAWLASASIVKAHGPGDGLQALSRNGQPGRSQPRKPTAKVITVRPPIDVMNRQGLRQFVGISQTTAGAKGLSMNLIIIPPGAAAKPHLHRGFESAIYILKGRAETRYGEGLKQSVINKAGDFLFIPPDLPHQPRNLSSTEPVMAIVARNDPNEQESVVHYDPDAAPAAKP